MAYTYVWQAIFRQIPARGEGKVIAAGRSFRELPWCAISSAMTWNFHISILRYDTYWNLNFRLGFRLDGDLASDINLLIWVLCSFYNTTPIDSNTKLREVTFIIQ